MTRQQKMIAILMALILFVSVPVANAQNRPGANAGNCGFARKVEFFAAMSAFGLSFIPVLMPVTIAYAGVAIAARGYVVARCE